MLLISFENSYRIYCAAWVVIQHLQLNKPDFRPRYMVNYLQHTRSYYGIILMIASHEQKMIVIIQELETVHFDFQKFAFEVKISKNLMRITKDKLLSRKCYYLWKLEKDSLHYWKTSRKKCLNLSIKTKKPEISWRIHRKISQGNLLVIAPGILPEIAP